MRPNPTIARYRRWYRNLLRLYSRPYRNRFAESMEQTFTDLCRERAAAGKRLLGFVLWTFVETSASIIQEHARSIVMQNITRRLAAWAIVVALILLVPLLGQAPWTRFDFILAGTVLFGAALTYELIARIGGTTAYRAAVGIAVATGLLLFWINAAVGIIGDGPVNLLYLGVLAVAFFGAAIAHFQPRGTSRALIAAAIAQMLVPLIALAIWQSGGRDWLIHPNSPHAPFHPGIPQIFALNAVFAALWLAAAFLFRHATQSATITTPHFPPLDGES